MNTYQVVLKARILATCIEQDAYCHLEGWRHDDEKYVPRSESGDWFQIRLEVSKDVVVEAGDYDAAKELAVAHNEIVISGFMIEIEHLDVENVSLQPSRNL